MSGSVPPLSAGVLPRILKLEDIPCPIYLQIIGSKRVPTANEENDRCRLVVSDGTNTHPYCMLSTHMNQKYAEGDFENFSIVRVNRYVPSRTNVSVPNEKSVLILFDMETVKRGSEINEQISNAPKNGNSAAPAAAAAAPLVSQKENINDNSRFSSSTQQKSQSVADTSASLNNSSIIGGDLSEHLTLSIDNLSPYQNKWVIKARVTAKSPIRQWKNAKGEGKLFNIDLCDESGEIRCTGFREAVDRFYDMIQIDKVYYISRCQLKPANKQYSKLNNDYEMTITNDTQIQLCLEETVSIPKIRYNFIPITDIAEKNKDDIIDVLGVCRDIGNIAQITARASGNTLTKRELVLVDQTNASITLTLWGAEAENFSGFDHPVVLVKSAKIGEYGGGKTLSTMVSSTLQVNPDMPEAHQLKGWYDNDGKEMSFIGLSSRTGSNSATEWVTFSECVAKKLGQEKADYFQTMAMVHTVRSENMLYKACPSEGCNKKVVDSGNGTYRCEKCGKDNPSFKYRLLVNMLIGDWTSNRWVTFFGDVGEKIFGKSTEELANLMENDKTEFDALTNDVLFKPHIFKLRTRVETYGDVPRNRITGVALGETKISEYNAHLIANIRRLTGIQKT